MDLMMTEELCLPLPSPDGSMDAFRDGLTMFVSFAVFGLLPICGFVAAGILYPSMTTRFAVLSSCKCYLIVLGAIKARFHDKAYIRSGLETSPSAAPAPPSPSTSGRHFELWRPRRAHRLLARGEQQSSDRRGRARCKGTEHRASSTSYQKMTRCE